MKTETLEALRLDHSLGELSPEVSELLEAYLAQNPREAALTASLADTAALVRRAVRPGGIAANAELPPPRWSETTSPRLLRWSAPTRWLGLAASFAVVAGAAWLAGVHSSSSPKDRPLVASLDHPAASQQAVAPSLSDPTDVRAAHSSATRPQHYRLVWQSPLKRPQIQETP